MSINTVHLLIVGLIVALVISLFVAGWRRTLGHLVQGVLILALGVVLTMAMRGHTIFIGAMVVGAFMILRGFYYLLFTDV
jgi:hypothetical protein